MLRSDSSLVLTLGSRLSIVRRTFSFNVEDLLAFGFYKVFGRLEFIIIGVLSDMTKRTIGLEHVDFFNVFAGHISRFYGFRPTIHTSLIRQLLSIQSRVTIAIKLRSLLINSIALLMLNLHAILCLNTYVNLS